MLHTSNVAMVASLIADPARATMLSALLDGRALPAGELAFASGITAQTASSHLSKLLDGGLLAVETEGRHRYYRLAGAHVAEVIEQLAAFPAAGPVRQKALLPKDRELKFARRCYDHLAGELGVAVTRGLQEREFIIEAPDKRFDVTADGAKWFGSIGIDLSTVKPTRRGLARQCLDWTERRHHLAGPLGVRFLGALCTHGWLRRAKDSRAMTLTPMGQVKLKEHLGVELQPLPGHQ